MDVSFIVPALNEEKCLEKTLRSIKAQKTKLKFEIIVVDGGSKDKTVEIAKKYARVPREKSRSISSARNMGAELGKGKLLVFIDADTVLPRDYLQIVWDYMSTNEKTVALR